MRNERRDADGNLVALEADPATDDDRTEATSAGLDLVREVLQLRVPLPLAPSDGASRAADTRPFVPGVDDAELLAVNNRAFEWHPEQSGWTSAHLRARISEPWFDAEGFLVHEIDGRIAGFCWTKVHPAIGEEPALGEIYVIGVDPDLHGRGLGRSLVLAGLDHLSRQGLGTGMLHVEVDNDRARSLYESLGFTVHSSHCWWERSGEEQPA